MNIVEIREKYPEYGDVSDEKLLKGLHKKFYSDVPYDQFKQKATPNKEFKKPPSIAKRVYDIGEKTGFNQALGNIFGTLNAPSAFLWGSQQAQHLDPEAYAKLSGTEKALVSAGGGFESAWRAISKRGDWGTMYGQYFQSVTGKTVREQLPDKIKWAAPSIELLADVVTDPLLIFSEASALAKLNIKPGAKIKIPKGMKAEDVTNALNDLKKLSDSEKKVVVGKLTKALNERKKVQAVREEYTGFWKTELAKKDKIGPPLMKPGERPPAPLAAKKPAEEFITKRPRIEPKISTKLKEAKALGKLKQRPAAEQIKQITTADKLKKQGFDLSKMPTREQIRLSRAADTLDKINSFRSKKGLSTFDKKSVLNNNRGSLEIDLGAIAKEAKAAGLDVKDWLRKNGASDENIASLMKSAKRVQVVAKEEAGTIKPPAIKPKNISETFKRQREVAKKMRKVTPSKIRKSFVRQFVDRSGNVERKLLKDFGDEGKKVVMKHNFNRGASAEALRKTKDAQKRIFKGFKKGEKELFDEYTQSSRAVSISKDKGTGFKHADGWSGTDHAAYLDGFAGTIRDRLGVSESAAQKLLSKIKENSDRYFKEMDEALGRLRENDLISKEAYEALKKGKYQPRKVLEYTELERHGASGKISVPGSGLKKLSDEGSIRAIETDSELLLNEVIGRTETIISKNKANKALLDFTKANPNNGFVSEAKIARKTKKGEFVYQRPPAGSEKVSVMVDGKEKQLIMPKELAEEWIKSDPDLPRTTMNILGWLSGAKILRSAATGINPGFIVTNVPRDIGLIYQTTEEYSKHLPVMLAEIAGDMKTVAKDAFTKKGKYIDYIKEGGGMDFLTSQGRVSDNKLSKLQDVLGWLNEFSETTTRLALRERAIKNGKSAEEATWIARNYLDFSKGGTTAKTVDSFIPYFNAGIQATRGMGRAARNNPKLFAYKMANVMGLSGGLYLANKAVNPEALDAIPDRVKESNFIITTPAYDVNEKGEKQHFYMKIAKDQGQRVFSSMMDAMLERYHTGKMPTEQVLMGVQDLLSFATLDKLPPTTAAVLGYAVNKDFWTKDEIWRGPKDIDSAQEFFKGPNGTHPFFVSAGKATGTSPERLKYAASKFFTHSNFYIQLVGGSYKIVSNHLSDKTNEKTIKQMALDIPGVRRVFSKTPKFNPKDRKKIEAQQKIENTKRWVANRDFDHEAKKLIDNGTPGQRKKIRGLLREASPLERKRLAGRLKRAVKLKDVKNKGFWLNMAELNPEARALMFWNDYREAGKDKKQEMLNTAEMIPGFASQRFKKALKGIK